MDVAYFARLVEDGAIMGAMWILVFSWAFAVWIAWEYKRNDIVIALAMLVVLVLITWQIHWSASSFYQFFRQGARPLFKAMVGKGYEGIAGLIFVIFSSIVFCCAFALFISRRVIHGLPAVLDSMDASRGREYEQLRAAVVTAEGVVVEGAAVRRGRLEKAEFVCEDGTRYALEGALLALNPPRLMLPDGRTLRLGRRNAPADSRLAATTGRLRIPPPVSSGSAPPTVDMKRWEDDMQW